MIWVIEKRLVELHKNLPHLPLGGQKWLANNVWWIVLIGAVLSGVGVVALVLLTMLGGVFIAGAVFLFSAKFGGLALLFAVAAVALMILNLIVSILAITPLKAHMRNGWLLLTASLAISFVAAVLTDVIKQDAAAIIKALVFLAIGAYMIFEIRDYFAKPLTDDAKADRITGHKVDTVNR